MGHDDQFRPPSLSGGCRLGKATFAGTGGKEEDAPIPDARCDETEPLSQPVEQRLCFFACTRILVKSCYAALD